MSAENDVTNLDADARALNGDWAHLNSFDELARSGEVTKLENLMWQDRLGNRYVKSSLVWAFFNAKTARENAARAAAATQTSARADYMRAYRQRGREEAAQDEGEAQEAPLQERPRRGAGGKFVES